MNKAGEYIGDVIYGANDGIITTFAIVASVAGAALAPKIVVILGVANLLADGFSMASSNYLARRSEQEYIQNVTEQTISTHKKHPIKNAMATFCAFVVAGFVPLIPFVFGVQNDTFLWAILATSIILFTVGALRALVTKSRWWLAGIEMLFVGALAAGVAYFIGYLLGNLI